MVVQAFNSITQTYFCVGGQAGIQTEFQDSQDYTWETISLKDKKKKKIKTEKNCHSRKVVINIYKEIRPYSSLSNVSSIQNLCPKLKYNSIYII